MTLITPLFWEYHPRVSFDQAQKTLKASRKAHGRDFDTSQLPPCEVLPPFASVPQVRIITDSHQPFLPATSKNPKQHGSI
jgi:hypothetical protein